MILTLVAVVSEEKPAIAMAIQVQGHGKNRIGKTSGKSCPGGSGKLCYRSFPERLQIWE